MKKVLIVFLCVSVLFGAFAACSKDDKKDNKESVSTTQEITTDDAVITQSDAINLIKSYSADELGLSKSEMKECSFLVKSSGVKYEKNYYINVIATIKTAHEDTTDKDGKKVTSYTFDNKGEYLIRYDGKEILAKNGDSDYRKLKVKAVPTTTPQKEQEKEKDEETSK